VLVNDVPIPVFLIAQLAFGGTFLMLLTRVKFGARASAATFFGDFGMGSSLLTLVWVAATAAIEATARGQAVVTITADGAVMFFVAVCCGAVWLAERHWRELSTPKTPSTAP
jgi:hypothetical protein